VKAPDTVLVSGDRETAQSKLVHTSGSKTNDWLFSSCRSICSVLVY